MGETSSVNYLDDSKFQIILQKVRFDKVEIPSDLFEDSNIEMKTNDSYRIREITSDEVAIQFTREKYFEPSALFEAEIVFAVKYKLQLSQVVGGDKEKLIRQEIENRYHKLLTPAAVYASMIMATLTAVDWRIPVVDPPYPLKKT